MQFDKKKQQYRTPSELAIHTNPHSIFPKIYVSLSLFPESSVAFLILNMHF